MHTKNSQGEAVKAAMATLLNARLADLIDLFTQTKHAHWNVRGPGFIAVHELFDRVADKIEDLSDEVAERLMALGGRAEGTARSVAQRSSLAEYPPQAVTPEAHVDALSSALAQTATQLRLAIDTADSAGDRVTADLFTRAAGEVDALTWLVESNAPAR